MKAIAPLFFLVAVSAAAQVRESTTVEVVEVPVYVTAQGAPVTALTRDNFELYVDGKRQSIDYFDTIDYATISPNQSVDLRQRRLYMLVFDLLSSPNALHRAQRATVQFIDHSAANDTFGVATFGRDGMKVIVPFSRDKLAVRHAVRNFDFSRAGDPLHLTMSTAERGTEGGHPATFIGPRYETDAFDPMLDFRSLIADEIFYLGELAKRLAGMEGHKHIVLLSNGFDSSILTGITAPPRMGDIRLGPMRNMSDLNRSMASALSAPPNAPLMAELRAMSERFAGAGVFLDAIDIAGLRPFANAYDNESLYAMTRDTGGQVVDRRNDLSAAIEHLTSLQRVVYILGFHAHSSDNAPKKIRVKLIGVPRGSLASYRTSYTPLSEQLDTADPLRLADIINNDIPQNGVTTNLSVERADHGATVEVSIPGRELLAQAAGDVIGADVMLYVASGPSVVAFKIKKIDIDVPRAAASLASAPVRVRETFQLPPGKYAAKVLIRIHGTGTLGFGRTDFTVPE